ncbi:MAG: hypothetical protein RBR81_13760 [Bacteroidales bacterium]|jgi:uncharacterized coiled-coil protein SlyX|nr:hypothetical protein [Bacteroidales bacterium]
MEIKIIDDSKAHSDNLVVNSKLNRVRKEGKVKGILATSVISLILIAGLGVLAYHLHKRDHNAQAALFRDQEVAFTQKLTERDSMLNDWLVTFDEIEKNLRMIREKEKIITVNSAGSEISKSKRDQILEDIRSINSLLEENKNKIARLNSQLKKSGNTIAGLQSRVNELEASVMKQETEITLLKASLDNKDFEIGQLNSKVVALNDTLTMREEIIGEQIYKLNQAFMVSGTFRDLKEKGLLSKEGGFLGIGRKESLADNFADSIFTEIDITQITTIPVNSRKVKLVTEHPANSYELIKESEDQIASIAIVDPEEFWKVSKYAVVEIIK